MIKFTSVKYCKPLMGLWKEQMCFEASIESNIFFRKLFCYMLLHFTGNIDHGLSFSNLSVKIVSSAFVYLYQKYEHGMLFVNWWSSLEIPSINYFARII